MDPAVGLVQAYLRLNGFFTVTEYPIIAGDRKGAHALTDLDILAVRFPNAQHWISGRNHGGYGLENDPILDIEPHCMQMIIGEVKEGKARLNPKAYTAPVIEAAIRRFGCCETDPAAIARDLIENGTADTHLSGLPCRVRMMVFGGDVGSPPLQYDVVGLRHIVGYLNDFVRRHAREFLSTQVKDESFDLMTLLVKIGIRIPILSPYDAEGA